MADSNQTLAIIEHAAEWAMDQTDLHLQIKPLAEHFALVADVMTTEVLLAVAKALECGIWLGKFGFPSERTELPEYLRNAFKGEENEQEKA